MNLNPKQREAVETIDGPVLVVSAPGSGKTRVVTERIKNILRNGASPADILAIAFTNSAAREMKDRLVKDLGETANKLTICTFHKLAIKIIRTYGHLLGYRPDFTIYDENDQLDIVRVVMKDMGLKKPKADRVLRNLREIKYKDIFMEYRDRLKAANAFDFDMLIEVSLVLLQNFKQVKEDLSYRYRYISIDEFQDINRLQYLMAKVLSSRWKNICAVGDPSQNIFTFQGADIQYILNLNNVYPGLRTVTNDTTFRCPSNVLHHADVLVRHNKNRLITNPTTSNPEGVIQIVPLQDSFEEAAWIANKCKELHDNGLAYREMAVLYRLHRLREEIQACLRAQKIPTVVCGRTKHFFQEPVIKEFHFYLRVLNNFYDDLSFKNIVNVPPRGINWRHIAKIEIFARAADMSIVGGAIQYFKNQNMDASWLEEIVSWKDLTFIDQVGRVRDTLQKHYDSQDLLTRCDQLQALQEFINNWRRQNIDCGLKEYLEDISELSAQDDIVSEDDEDAVQLMTIHTAKGLEFPAVFVPGLEEGTFPVLRASITDEEIEEERRLFYVAITRTEQMLYLTYARKREYWGREKEMDPSRFLSEMES
jgi:DNA helicase-2/ATP-dependent DNA helicase PcrA